MLEADDLLVITLADSFQDEYGSCLELNEDF